MSAEVVVGIASATVSVVGAIAAGLMTTWSAQRTRLYENLLQAQQKAQSKAEQAEAILSRYREPLLGAAQNLHSRLYTMVEHDALAVHLHSGDADLERYARDYTIYVLAEYLCWAEIVRRDLRFLDLASEERNREFVRLLEVNQLALSNEAFPRPLRLYRGEQRAIGELMMIPTGDPASAQYESLGYVQFCIRLDDDPAFTKWFILLRDGLYQVANTEAERPQIASLQNGLIDLIEFLDPQQLRLPGRLRDRLTPSGNDIPATTTDLSHFKSAAIRQYGQERRPSRSANRDHCQVPRPVRYWSPRRVQVTPLEVRYF
jgi:hypothetical protein